MNFPVPVCVFIRLNCGQQTQVLKDGGGAAQIQQRMEDGTLEDYGKIPAMEDVKNNIRARKGKEL